MLAPRKSLWSTPIEVIDKAIEQLSITSTDIVYDIGAGDGRFLIRCVENTTVSQCIGINNYFNSIV
jgi:tRNA G46 methylase TrmB